MKRNISTLLLAAMLVGTTSMPAFAGSSFVDVPDDNPYAKFIANLKNKGVVNGIGEGKYGPNDQLTRAQFATFLAKAFNLSETKDVPFEDIKGHWATFYIQAAYAAGIVNGTSATTFEPDAKVRREEAATMIWRYLKSKGVDLVTNEVQLDESVDDWAVEAVKNIIGYQLYGPEVTNHANGWKYRSTDVMNRQEMSALIDLAMEKLDPTKPELPLQPSNIVYGQFGSMANPAVPKKGITMVIKQPDGSPSRTTQVIDILNPTENVSNLIFDESTNTYKIGNIPMIITVEDGDQQFKDVYATITANANTAAKLFSKLTFKYNADGSITMQLPSINGSGLYWKYYNDERQINGTREIIVSSENPLTIPEMNLPERMFTLYLDRDTDSSKISFPGASITILNKGKAGDVEFSLIYSTIDIN